MSPDQRPTRVLQSFPHKIGAGPDLHDGLAPGDRRRRGRRGPAGDARRRAGRCPKASACAPRWRAAACGSRIRRSGAMRAFKLHDRLVARGAAAARRPDRHRPRLAAGRPGDAAGRPPARHPDGARAAERAHALRLRGGPRRVRAARRPAARRSRARLQRGDPRARGGGVRARRPAAVPVRVRRADVPGPGLTRRSSSSGTSTATTRRSSARRPARATDGEGLTVIFVGVAAVRKGLHFALEAWLRSPASENGHVPDRRRVPARLRGEARGRSSRTRACRCSATATTCRT